MSDNPDLADLEDAEPTTVRKAALRALFDLAVGSMDFGSDFWETADTLVAREIAEALGLCPMVATPSSHRSQFPICDGLRAGIAKAEAFWQHKPTVANDAIRWASHEDHDRESTS